jgi:hypothetical protein
MKSDIPFSVMLSASTQVPVIHEDVLEVRYQDGEFDSASLLADEVEG